MMTTEPQISVFLITLYGGIASGIIYDIYRALRKVTGQKRLTTALIDAVFVLIIGAVILSMLYIANKGELRLYTFVGVALGFALYMTGLSPFIIFMYGKIKNRLQK